jgi:RNA polymerase sigma factor (sigma-70 family)
MATGQLSGVLQQLRGAVLLREAEGLTDGQLLEAYISHRDEAAVAALVQRHGPMVWGVCRRVLGNHQDAEDAFQATFFVLVRKAAAIASPALLANWLYGVALQTALKARTTVARRKVRERQVTDMPEPAVAEQDLWEDLRPLLDQELSRLPDRSRAVIVLCDLEGKTRQEAARYLGLPEGTVASRLARARVMLAKRLARRGVVLSAGALAAALARNVAAAGVPTSVASSTVRAASHLAAGQAATGVISAKVVALAEGVMKTMFLTKLKVATVVLLVVVLIGVGAVIGVRAQKALAAGPPNASKTPPGKEADKPRTDKDLLQGTWEFVSLTQGGQTLQREDFGDKNAPIKAITFIGDRWVGVVVNTGSGKEVEFKGDFKLDPSRKPKEIDLIQEEADPRPTPSLYELDGDSLRLCFPGRPGQERPSRLESKEGESCLLVTYKRVAPKQEQKRDKEGFTAWGKEVGGLQAGLGLGQKLADNQGEAVTLVVRVRNVGKEPVKRQYDWSFFVENQPAVTDGEGKRVPGKSTYIGGVLNVPVELNLAPGKEIDLFQSNLELQPGKFQIQYEQVFGNAPGAVPIKLDPTLSKLSTGKLGVEIKSDPRAPTGKEPPGNKDREDADRKPIKIRVYIEKVNVDTSTITASCMLIGEFDGVTKPLRFENLGVSEKAKITDGGKELKLADVKLLPRDTHFYLILKAYSEFGFEVVGIETIRK